MKQKKVKKYVYVLIPLEYKKDKSTIEIYYSETRTKRRKNYLSNNFYDVEFYKIPIK